MSDMEERYANEFDKLEALLEKGVNPEKIEDRALAESLMILQILNEGEPSEQAPPMPRAQAFRKEVRIRTKPVHLRSRFTYAALALAASFLLGAILIFKNPNQPAGLVLAPELLSQAMEHHTDQSVMSYLESTEKLLLSIRDHEISCGQNQLDFAPEKRMASSLLMQQKLFSSQVNKPRYWQTRKILAQLERILVDVNSLDPCADPFEIDFINEYIHQKRILGKLRLVAQEFQHS